MEDNADCVNLAREQLYMHDMPFFPSSDVDRLLSDPSLDGVFVLTPTATHADLVCRSLEKGKAVFVEKPTGETPEEIAKMLRDSGESWQAASHRLSEGFQDLYQAVLKGDAVGKMYNIKTVSRDSPKTVITSFSRTPCMTWDIIVWLTQCEQPEFIYVVTHAHDAELAVNNIADSLTVVIKYKSGVIATIDSCRETTGKVTAENVRETTSMIDGVSGGSVRRIYHSFPQRFEKAFQAEIEHFMRCMDGALSSHEKEGAL
nr:hypothetical protein BaRGS_027282 [Batillaria attramentaria]